MKEECCEKPAYCRCIEHGGKCQNCGFDRNKDPRKELIDTQMNMIKDNLELSSKPLFHSSTTPEVKVFTGEINKCSFCQEVKGVSRFYVRPVRKWFDDNVQGKYSDYISYCGTCGIESEALSNQKQEIAQSMKEKSVVLNFEAERKEPIKIEAVRLSDILSALELE